jgi:hypothetical protein
LTHLRRQDTCSITHLNQQTWYANLGLHKQNISLSQNQQPSSSHGSPCLLCTSCFQTCWHPTVTKEQESIGIHSGFSLMPRSHVQIVETLKCQPQQHTADACKPKIGTLKFEVGHLKKTFIAPVHGPRE